ncbi:hypothetical protein CTEN210_08090 [Chaetoceros tenuissimus]|uniref:Uncharacterized protein n=1 Tax=Chaetoceros tenuissimus TaxID=426638 RepID=A0AAD3CW03_9STRA|nr:hypothetical protein CTEN210_08090 [Chaetoceros tenuissimus]
MDLEIQAAPTFKGGNLSSANNPFDSPVSTSKKEDTSLATPGFPAEPLTSQSEVRSKRLREEAIRRLVNDVQRTATTRTSLSTTTITNAQKTSQDEITNQQQEDLLIASTLATAIERGLDRELHNELCKEVKSSAANISKICHEHSDGFLHSVGKVVGLGISCDHIKSTIEQANDELQSKTVKPMLEAAQQLEYTKTVSAKAKTIHAVVTACYRVSTLLQKAKKQADLARPRGALDAVDEARACLTASLGSLVGVGTVNSEEMKKIFQDLLKSENMNVNDSSNPHAPSTPARNQAQGDKDPTKANNAANTNEKDELRLEDTPFGARAMELLPRIENEVISGARRDLNKWFLSIRSGGDGAKAGRAALRKCSNSMSMGPGYLGHGGKIQGYTWRAKNADNLISRVDQGKRVSRAIRMGYWFARDNEKEIERLTRLCDMGVERRAEAFATAFGWYRCWNETASLDVDEGKAAEDESLGRSGHGSTHGNLGGSRHGRSLNFRASNRRDGAITYRSGRGGAKENSPWAATLIPSILFNDSPTKNEDEEKLLVLPESVHPVRRAESAFALLGKKEDFRQYYEQNRFGATEIGDKSGETRSALSSLTGDDVSQGTDRVFYARSLPHLCTSVAGFSAIEAALELGIVHEDEEVDLKTPQGASATDEDAKEEPTSFKEISARYERKLITELGTLTRKRAIGATLVELAKSSCLLTAFRAALKVVHPSSTSRPYDKELLAMDVDILITALKVAQDEQLRATQRILTDDSKQPMRVTRSDFRFANQEDTSSIPAPEHLDQPFGLYDMKQKSNSDFSDVGSLSSRGQINALQDGDTYKFSAALPQIVRSIHARTITFAAFAVSQEELGQVFPMNKGIGVAGYVLDCLEQCISAAAIGIKNGYEHFDELSVPEAVQITANISSLQACLPRIFGTVCRGLCHIGSISEEKLNETFDYAEEALSRADKACDAQVAGMFNSVYELCRNKIDTLLHFSLDNFQWVARSQRDSPNTYCESLIEYLRTIFKCLRSLDEGSKAGLHFSCCGHISERLVMLVAGKVTEEGEASARSDENGGLRPIAKIDAYGLKNLSLDVAEFESFTDGTGIPQLRECFAELKCITDAMLDPELPQLLMPEHENARRRKYPFLNLEKVCNILEKYQAGGLRKLMGSSSSNTSFLMLEKKDISNLLRLARSQI